MGACIGSKNKHNVELSNIQPTQNKSTPFSTPQPIQIVNIDLQTPTPQKPKQNQQASYPLNPLQVQVEVKLIDGETKFAKLSENRTGLSLKQYIQDSMKSRLQLNEMNIYHNGIQIQNDNTLSQLLNGSSRNLKIIQKGMPMNRKVQIKLINKQIQALTLFDDIPGINIKGHIYKFICPELSPEDMSLYCGDVKIQNHVHLSDLKIPKSQIIKIIQKKLEVKDYPETYLKIYPNEDDAETYETGVVEMTCGCRKGQQAMTIILNTLVKQSRNTIACANHPNIQWQIKICKKVARLTLSERIFIQSELSKNFIANKTHNNTIVLCRNDKCKTSIIIQDTTLVKIGCPKCRQEFCIKCKNKWVNNKNQQFCGNTSCVKIQQELNKLLADCPEKDMPLLVAKVSKNFKVPNLRSCVFCRNMIQHVKACKHMTCSDCKQKFCFVCLKKFENGKWPCGGYDQYCNTIHPRQKL